jgi:peptidoglycan hydrolase-like protein with peptidoglycan-binding domain
MTATTVSPWPLIRKGDQNHPVKTLQYLLQARGHGVTVDGIFGPKTDAAVRDFQRALHQDIPSVTVDGIVGPVTWRALVSGMLSF